MFSWNVAKKIQKIQELICSYFPQKQMGQCEHWLYLNNKSRSFQFQFLHFSLPVWQLSQKFSFYGLILVTKMYTSML